MTRLKAKQTMLFVMEPQAINWCHTHQQLSHLCALGCHIIAETTVPVLICTDLTAPYSSLSSYRKSLAQVAKHFPVY